MNTETQERTTEDIAIREYIDSTKSELNEKIDKLIGSGGETEGGLAAEVEARIQGDKYNFDLLKFAIQRVNSSAGLKILIQMMIVFIVISRVFQIHIT